MANTILGAYKNLGLALDLKHVELVVRETFAEVKIKHAGDTRLAKGSTITRVAFDTANDQMVANGLGQATGRLVAKGINSFNLHADKPLVAASFSHAVKHLAAAAVKGQTEHLTTMREKVMIGGLIPAGTGFPAKTPVVRDGVNG